MKSDRFPQNRFRNQLHMLMKGDKCKNVLPVFFHNFVYLLVMGSRESLASMTKQRRDATSRGHFDSHAKNWEAAMSNDGLRQDDDNH